MKIMVLGLRGMPGVQGGVETHAEHLYPILVEMGCQVEVIVRRPFHPIGKDNIWRGVRLRPLWSPRARGVEALVHTIIGVLYAGMRRPDVLHIHAIGPALVVPLARLLGLRVVVTHHGPDYDRQKWGILARLLLRFGEYSGMCFANKRIVISKVIAELVSEKYGKDSILIPNGVTVHELSPTDNALRQFDLAQDRYILQVSRFVPEKRQVDLITAFAQAKLPGWKLVLVGELDNRDRYTLEILQLVQKTPNVILTDFQSGVALQELYSHAGAFVLTSSHEGLPIALLEALSYGLRVFASDIPANLEIGLSQQQYFPLGDVEALTELLRHLDMGTMGGHNPDEIRGWVKERYNWKQIAKQTMLVYESEKT